MVWVACWMVWVMTPVHPTGSECHRAHSAQGGGSSPSSPCSPCQAAWLRVAPGGSGPASQAGRAPCTALRAMPSWRCRDEERPNPARGSAGVPPHPLSNKELNEGWCGLPSMPGMRPSGPAHAWFGLLAQALGQVDHTAALPHPTSQDDTAPSHGLPTS